MTDSVPTEQPGPVTNKYGHAGRLEKAWIPGGGPCRCDDCEKLPMNAPQPAPVSPSGQPRGPEPGEWSKPGSIWFIEDEVRAIAFRAIEQFTKTLISEEEAVDAAIEDYRNPGGFVTDERPPSVGTDVTPE